MNVRKPAVSGKFYPSNKDELINLLHSIHLKEEKKFIQDFSAPVLIGGVAPHAGYVYSGYQAVHLFEVMKKHPVQFDTIVIIHPNHNGVGPDQAVDEHDFWETPLGQVPLDLELMEKIDLPGSALAHKFEHSAEVMLPFIQYKIPYDVKIMPIAMARQTPEHARSLANALFEANKTLQKKIFVIASSDFSHYVSPEAGYKMDQMVLDEILPLDTEGIYQVVKKHNISVCGFGPIMTLVEYSRRVARYPEVKILRRGHSGEAFASKEVVDYITLLFYSQIT